MKQSKTLSALAVALWLAFGFSSLSLAVSPSDIEAAYTVGAVSDSNQSVTKAAAEKGKVTVKKKGVDKTSSSEKKGTKGDTPAKSSTAGESSELQPVAVSSVPRDAKPAGARGVLRTYHPATDAAPAEPMAIKETNFRFNEPLLLRPKTDMIVIHHVGIPDGDTSAAAIHRAHLANGWAGIGYHYVIRKDGTIERGRPLATVGAHAQGQNYHTVGINVTGNFDKEIPTPAQLHALTGLVAWLCKIYEITPSAATIVGHRDVNSTDCPGQHLYDMLPQIRRDVEKRMETLGDAAPSYEDTLKEKSLLKMSRKEREAFIMQGTAGR